MFQLGNRNYEKESFTMLWKTTALILALAIASARAAAPADVTPPAVPANLEAPAGHQVFLIAQGEGTQNYICMPSATGVAWTFLGPQATLFDSERGQVMTHYLSPNPAENNTPRATWQHSHDTSTVWAVAIASSSDPNFVAPNAVPWLLLQIAGTQHGPAGGDRMMRTTFIQRVNTAGGVAPAAGCGVATDVGRRALVPYTTDYVFYRSKG
jgi:hypothetical protein